MSRCIVTGHKGYIGSKLTAKLREQGHEVIGIDLNDEHPKDILNVLILRCYPEFQYSPALGSIYTILNLFQR